MERIQIDVGKLSMCNCADLRCECGSLLARLIEEGIEIKCRRCKRLVLIYDGTEGHKKG